MNKKEEMEQKEPQRLAILLRTMTKRENAGEVHRHGGSIRRT